jgi:DNA-binding response OmpR family regulator
VRDLTIKAQGLKSPISVIIIGSSSLLVDSFQQIMKYAGFNVEIAKSGEEAISKIEVVNFNLALIENNLPDISGRYLAKMLKEYSPGINVMLLNDSIISKRSILMNDIKIEAVDPEEPIKINRFLDDNR